jgi:hypothetical protein
MNKKLRIIIQSDKFLTWLKEAEDDSEEDEDDDDDEDSD